MLVRRRISRLRRSLGLLDQIWCQISSRERLPRIDDRGSRFTQLRDIKQAIGISTGSWE